MPVQLLTIEDARKDANVRKHVTPDLKEGHYVVFTTGKPLPHDTKCGVKVGPEVPSIEGPIVSSSEYTLNFITNPPFAVTNPKYNLAEKKIVIQFNQKLIADEYSAEKTLVRIYRESESVNSVGMATDNGTGDTRSLGIKSRRMRLVDFRSERTSFKLYYLSNQDTCRCQVRLWRYYGEGIHLYILYTFY